MGVCVCMFLCFCFYLPDFSFTLCLGFVFCFFLRGEWGSVCFNPFYCHDSLWGLGSLTRSWARASGMGALSPGCWITRELLTPGSITQRELPQRPPPKSKTWHHSTACSTAALDTSPKQQARQEHTPNHQQTGLPTDTPKHITSHGPAHQREKTPLPPGCRHKAFRSHQTNLIRQGKKPETILSFFASRNQLSPDISPTSLIFPSQSLYRLSFCCLSLK